MKPPLSRPAAQVRTAQVLLGLLSLAVAACPSQGKAPAASPQPFVLQTSTMTVTVGAPQFSLQVQTPTGQTLLSSYPGTNEYSPLSATHRAVQFRPHIIEGWDYQLATDAPAQGISSVGGRTYALTSQGKAYVKEHADEIAAPWEALSNAAGDDFVEMMSQFHQLGAAAMQVVQAGSAAQIAKAKKILVATRRSLYEILAEGSSEDK